MRVAVGEEHVGEASQVMSQSSSGSIALPRFRVESIQPEFWNDQLLFTTLTSELELADGTRATTRINRPLWLGWSSFLRLSGFGYAPRYELRDSRGRILDSAFVKLDVFPPGTRDSFPPEGWPHRVYVNVYPDYEPGPEGTPSTKTRNLTNPAIAVQVLRGKADLGTALLRGDESFEFEGLRLSFPEVAVWGDYTIVQDPGAPILFLGYVLGIAGLAITLALEIHGLSASVVNRGSPGPRTPRTRPSSRRRPANSGWT